MLLLTRDTRDVGYQKAEQRREAAMGRIVRRLSREARRARVAEADGSSAEGGPTRSSSREGRHGTVPDGPGARDK